MAGLPANEIVHAINKNLKQSNRFECIRMMLDDFLLSNKNGISLYGSIQIFNKTNIVDHLPRCRIFELTGEPPISFIAIINNDQTENIFHFFCNFAEGIMLEGNSSTHFD